MGCLLGSVFLAVLLAEDPFRLAAGFRGLPLVAMAAIAISLVGQFAILFTATGLEFRAQSDPFD